MPLYQYKCSSCNHTFDLFEKMESRHKPTKDPCPSCKNLTVEKLMSMMTVVDPITVGNLRTSNGFNAVMKEVKKRNPKHNISDKFLR